MKTQKTMRDIVHELIQMGFSVKYRERSDGGILITQINGAKYSGAQGNTIARGLVGSQLSTARQSQLQTIKRPRKPQILSTQIQKELRSLQRLERLKGKTTTKKKDVEAHFQRYGAKETIQTLHKKKQRIYGYAYEANVEWFIQRFSHTFESLIDANMLSSNSIRLGNKIVEYLETHKSKIPDEQLMKAYEYYYDMEKPTNDNDQSIQIIATLFNLF